MVLEYTSFSCVILWHRIKLVVQSWNFQVKLLWYLGCPKKILVPFLLEAVAADLSVVCDLKWQIVSRLCYEFHKRQYILNSDCFLSRQHCQQWSIFDCSELGHQHISSLQNKLGFCLVLSPPLFIWVSIYEHGKLELEHLLLSITNIFFFDRQGKNSDILVVKD